METDFLLQELERMGANAADFEDDEISEVDINRWRTLFSTTYEDAENSIKAYRADIDRQRFSGELWLELRASKEAQGFDREACEYALFCRSKVMNADTPTTSPRSAHSLANDTLSGLILGGPLSTPEDARDIAGFTPTVAKAESEDSSASFCYVTAEEEQRIRKGLGDRGVSFEPWFITINVAAKHHSALPKLGVDDTTMPQHRLNNITDLTQQYPILYFFYGTLAQPEVLKRVLESEHEPNPSSLQPAHVLGGKITNLGQYRALVNSSSDSRVSGHAFMVQSENQERALRLHETKLYEVVRCDIWLSGRSVPVKGLTFRLAASR
ncbi:unnamed protein product [Aureobasidium vineae]|uniref:Putative gamma-glutamylcyclotransferase n=1 Tax=Aureobasidium vineae TaxID=2773715 RepID=A0A9N8JEU5_9PEZI|nr:unnamed protein product [Aureobasidium vineae]